VLYIGRGSLKANLQKAIFPPVFIRVDFLKSIQISKPQNVHFCGEKPVVP